MDISNMETIFDHNMTEEELIRLTAGVFSQKEYIESLSQDACYFDIYQLYLLRNDQETANKYYLMINEENRKAREEIIKNRVIA